MSLHFNKILGPCIEASLASKSTSQSLRYFRIPHLILLSWRLDVTTAISRFTEGMSREESW